MLNFKNMFIKESNGERVKIVKMECNKKASFRNAKDTLLWKKENKKNKLNKTYVSTMYLNVQIFISSFILGST